MTKTIVDLLVLNTPNGPVPYAYADNEVGKVNLLRDGERYVKARLATSYTIRHCSARFASRAICHPLFKHPQMVLGHALARIEGRTAKSFEQWYGLVA